MIPFDREDAQMLHHIVKDVMADRLAYDAEYTEKDRQVVDKLGELADAAATGTVLAVTGRDLTDDRGTNAEARKLFHKILNAELDHWVPNASQRLLHRAGAVLGVPQPKPRRDDCGPTEFDHALIHDWVGSAYLLRCSTCLRLYRG